MSTQNIRYRYGCKQVRQALTQLHVPHTHFFIGSKGQKPYQGCNSLSTALQSIIELNQILLHASPYVKKTQLSGTFCQPSSQFVYITIILIFFSWSRLVDVISIPVCVILQPKKEGTVFTLFKMTNIRKKTIVMSTLWFTCGLVGFGMTFNVGEQLNYTL